MFDRAYGRAAKSTPNTLPMVSNETIAPVANLAELTTFIQAAISAKQYVTYGQAAVVLGFATMNNGSVTGFQNRDIRAIVSYFGEAHPGGDAIIVNGKGAHDIKVAAQHRRTLETPVDEGGLGYTQFPRITIKGQLLDGIAQQLPQN